VRSWGNGIKDIPLKMEIWRLNAFSVCPLGTTIELETWCMSYISHRGTCIYISCRTVALWFYILVFDHNATVPVMQKSCNLWLRFFCALLRCISPLLSFPPSNIFYSWIVDISYYQFTSICLYKPVNSLVSNYLQ
jgi:hypothetical protein